MSADNMRDARDERIDAWDTVANVLLEVDPKCFRRDGSGEDNAVFAIRRLARIATTQAIEIARLTKELAEANAAPVQAQGVLTDEWVHHNALPGIPDHEYVSIFGAPRPQQAARVRSPYVLGVKPAVSAEAQRADMEKLKVENIELRSELAHKLEVMANDAVLVKDLRAQLARIEPAEPVGYFISVKYHDNSTAFVHSRKELTDAVPLYAASQPRIEASEPVVWVPVHPRNGPLWMNAITSMDQDRPSYPLMPLYAAPQPIAQPAPSIPDGWIAVADRLPEPDTEVLIDGQEGVEVARYQEACEDQTDDMGHDAGWFGYKFAHPGRSIGAPSHQYPSQGQPAYWMPLPVAPDNEDQS